jgi:hypothetical protein
MGQRHSLMKSDPRVRWPRYRPHGNRQSEWRSKRKHRRNTSVPDVYEAECQRAIAAFLNEQSKVNTVSD